MPDLFDLIVLVFALGLGLPGLWLVGREVLGDRLRRARVAHLRCPGRWERRLWLIPWRADCWYDLTAIAPGADRTRRCPECGRRSPESRLKGARRSVVRAGLGLLLCGAAAVALKGHQIYMGGVSAAPNWVLALIPFDDQAWFERRIIQTGDPWRDRIAEELSQRNGLALLDGLGGRMMFERVRRSLARAGEWHDAPRQERGLALLRRKRLDEGLRAMRLQDATRDLAARLGVVVRLIEPTPATPPSAVPPTGPNGPQQWISNDGAIVTLNAVNSGGTLAALPGSPGGAGVSLPAWSMTAEQALDLLVDRAQVPGLDWRLEDDGTVVIDVLPGADRYGAYADRALGSLGARRTALASAGTIGSTTNYLPAQTVTGVFITSTGAQVSSQRAAPREGPRRSLAARGWVASASSFVWTPLRAVGGPASYALMPTRGWTAHTGVGGWIIFQGSWTEHRRLRQIWEALEAGPAATPPDQVATLDTLARIDAPGPIWLGTIESADEGLAIIERERGVRLTIDDALLRRTLDDPAWEDARIAMVRAVLAWSPIARHIMVVRPGRALLTSAQTRDLLSTPRLYRVRVPTDRMSDRARSRRDGIWPATLAARASRLAGDFPILWDDHDPPGTYRFAARTTDDEHAMLSWLLEQVERTLATGQASPTSAGAGHPVAVYDLAALLSIDQARQKAMGGGQPDGAVAALERWLGGPLDGQDTPTGRPWVRTIGPIAILRMSVNDHARVRTAANEAQRLIGASADAPASPAG